MINIVIKKNHIKKIIPFLLIGLLLLSFYLLADRYLIEHEEKIVHPTDQVKGTDLHKETESTDAYQTESGVEDFAEGNEASCNSRDTDSADASSISIESTEATVTEFYDEWNYVGNGIEIHIEKVETGSGREMVTYFVADVVLNDVKSLKTAFAKNRFGRNIVEKTSVIAAENNAIFAINGDYYGFRSDGVIIRNGILYRDVPARKGAAIYKNGMMRTYEEKEISASTLLEEGVWSTFSFGPILIKNGIAVEDFTNTIIDNNVGNSSIHNFNPRTGFGMVSHNHFKFVVVDGRMKNYSKGMTLNEFAKLFIDLGCTEAYNLDGGGSATMYFMGRLVNNPLGLEKERNISDIIYVVK